MAYPPDQGLYTGVLRLVLVLVGVSLVGFTIGPSMLRRLTGNSTAQVSCPSCVCDCSSEDFLSIPLGILNSSFPDCGKSDPDMNEEMGKDFVALLSEELSLQKAVANDSMQHTKALISDARKAFSHYQKEAEKCSTVVETCEEGREKAERELAEELKLSALWEKRAHELGWKVNRRIYS
ncbi:hypothetical protein I3760_08G165400 [Carya illinoinensis]|uniref:DUF1068 domain-containing protein n=1 Tax=Carya illinoinensis TaxID=32201 RepID=A0A8T1PSI5_CARIL|nr:hypothetical protein I3760_08G165400 [Carya illinoinensis]KAG6646065.1 hypothetical protein CIPAW_08G167400 [Carya illinoinensis]